MKPESYSCSATAKFLFTSTAIAPAARARAPKAIVLNMVSMSTTEADQVEPRKGKKDTRKESEGRRGRAFLCSDSRLQSRGVKEEKRKNGNIGRGIARYLTWNNGAPW